MELILKSRQMGKTTEIIKIAAKNFSYIVCCGVQEADRVFKLAKNMELDIPYPLTIEEFTNGRFYTAGTKGLCIDNAEFVFQKMAMGVPINAISFTWPKEYK